MTQSIKEQISAIKKKMFIIAFLSTPVYFIAVMAVNKLLNDTAIIPIFNNINVVYITLGICAPIIIWNLITMPMLAIKAGKLEIQLKQENDQ